MTYHPRVPGSWRTMQRAAVDERARRQRALDRLNQRRCRLILDFLNGVFWICVHVMFWLFIALVVFAAICGVALSGLAADRRRRY